MTWQATFTLLALLSPFIFAAVILFALVGTLVWGVYRAWTDYRVEKPGLRLPTRIDRVMDTIARQYERGLEGGHRLITTFRH